MPSRAPRRETDRHAEQLKRELAAAWATTDGLIEARSGAIVGVPGRYLDFETLPSQPLPDVTWTSKGIRLASASRSSEGAAQGTIFIPDDAQGFLTTKLDEYQSQRGKKGRPAHQDRFAAIEHFRAARLESLWVDSRPIPAASMMTCWECWCWPDRVANLEAKASAIGVLIGEGRLRFAEREVVFVYGERATIAGIVATTDAVAELRLGRDDASFFTSGHGREDQGDWIENAVDRIQATTGCEVVAVCVLDTGINRAHPLLTAVFAADDLHSINPALGN